MLSHATRKKYKFTKEHDPNHKYAEEFEKQKEIIERDILLNPINRSKGFTVEFSPTLESYVAYTDDVIFAFKGDTLTRHYQTPVSITSDRELINNIQSLKETDTKSILAKYILDVKTIELSPAQKNEHTLFEIISRCAYNAFHGMDESPIVKLKDSNAFLICMYSPALKLMLNPYMFSGILEQLQALTQDHDFILVSEIKPTTFQTTLTLSAPLLDCDKIRMQAILKPKRTINLQIKSADANITLQPYLEDENIIVVNVTTTHDSKNAIDEINAFLKQFYMSDKFQFQTMLKELNFKDENDKQIAIVDITPLKQK